jgi:hypothetical protein
LPVAASSRAHCVHREAHNHCPEHRNGDCDEQPCGDAEQSGNARKIICVCGDGEEAKGYTCQHYGNEQQQACRHRRPSRDMGLLQ